MPTVIDPRLGAAVAAGRLAATLSQRLGRGGGTTLPGRVSRWLDAGAVEKLGRRLSGGAVVVTGTNGKTTTARLIANVLRDAGRRVVHNRSGANLLDGVTSALVRATSPFGALGGEVGVFEVDEASVPEVVGALSPRVVAVGNLFRDQLDRYGEVTFVVRRWREAVAALPESSTLVLNADDPNVASLGEAFPGRVIYVGVDDLTRASPELEHTADARLCPRCGARLDYGAVYYAHVGHYSCRSCGFGRPAPTISARVLQEHGLEGTEAEVRLDDAVLRLVLPLPGLYNVYNALLGLGAAVALGIEPAAALETIGRFSAAFGRIERLTVGDKRAFLALVKNPVGFNQVLRALLKAAEHPDVLIAINDNLADGTDVSWLWDVDFDELRGRARSITVGGTRGRDMLVRLKYAEVEGDITIEDDLARAFDHGLARVGPGGTLYVLPTYTAMLDLRAELARRGLVAPFWQD